MPGILTINLPQVVHETIDGETILIHLGTGAYYSIDGVGAEVWALLARELSDTEAIAAAKALYAGADPALVESAVGSFVAELIAEGLILEELAAQDAAGSVPTGGADAIDAAHAAGAAGEFSPPVLHKYTDMQEFMLVDPIHDVEAAAGWPHVKAG